jgi:hypothetical protein
MLPSKQHTAVISDCQFFEPIVIDFSVGTRNGQNDVTLLRRSRQPRLENKGKKKVGDHETHLDYFAV